MNRLTGTKKVRYNEFGVAPPWNGQGRAVIIANEYGNTILQYRGNKGWCDWRVVYLKPGLNHIRIPFHLARLDTRWRIPIKESA